MKSTVIIIHLEAGGRPMIFLLDVTSTVILIVSCVLLALALVLFIVHLIRDLGNDIGNEQSEALLKTIKGSLLVHDLMITAEGKQRRIDFVLIHPHGIFIIENNHYEGEIHEPETKIIRMHIFAYGQVKHHIYNPIKENDGHILAIQALLKPIGEYRPHGIVVSRMNEQLFVQANQKVLLVPCPIKTYLATHVIQKLSEAQMKKIYDFLVEAKIKGVVSHD